MPATASKSKTEISPTFADRPEINKLNEILITSKKKIVFRDKFIGKLDSLAKVNSFTSDFVCTATNYLNCPRCIDGCCPGERIKPLEGGMYTDTSNYIKIVPCGNYLNDDGKRNAYHYPDLTEADLLEMFNILMIKGYYGKKVFYEPIYDEVTINDPLPDYRNTLYWKPEIVTNELGEATVKFFCSDINSLFLGNIEGVSSDGLLGIENFEFSVTKK